MSQMSGMDAGLKFFKYMKDQANSSHLMRVGRAIMTPIKDEAVRLCPKEYKDLAYSGRIVEDPNPDHAQVHVIFGMNSGLPGDPGLTAINRPHSPGPWYAVIVHERSTWPNGVPVYHEPPTQWKYLETAVRELAPDMNRVAGEAFSRTFLVEWGSYGV